MASSGIPRSPPVCPGSVSWKIEDQSPVRLAAGDADRYVGAAPKVCARIADSSHHLVEAVGGGYTTGNCVTIDRG